MASKPPAPAAPPLTPEQIAHAQARNEALQKTLPPGAWDEVMQQIKNSCGTGSIRHGVVMACKRVAKTNCAGPKPDEKQRMSEQSAQSINKANGTKVDFGKLAQFEGGQATQGYVPWWPDGVTANEGVIGVNPATVKEGGATVLKGTSNSGVTVATGVDLGQQRPAAYVKRLKAAGVPQALIDKLRPYMGLKRAAACKYLREHPLEITKDEAEMLEKEMKSAHLKNTMTEYGDAANSIKDGKPFGNLSQEEQTILFSRHYQDGNIIDGNNYELAKEIASGESQAVLDRLSTVNYPGAAHKNRIPVEQSYLREAYKRTL